MTISFGILEVANDHFPPNHIQPLTISGPTCHLRFSGKISTFGFQFYLVGSPAHLIFDPVAIYEEVSFSSFAKCKRIVSKISSLLKGFDARQKEW